ncbi:MAG TPA: hypothetical protein VFE09_04480 [Rubrobacteraceae bacterium]|nr:hypothetical protein [Rubrobacteraceae bacterium]
MERGELIKTMESILGPEGVISDREQLRTYECDGLMIVTSNPGCMLQIQASLKKLGHDVPMAHPMEVLDASIRGEPVEALLR